MEATRSDHDGHDLVLDLSFDSLIQPWCWIARRFEVVGVWHDGFLVSGLVGYL